MRIITAPVASLRYSEKIGKTAVELAYQNSLLTCFVPGNKEDEKSLLCTIVVNEVGDKFTATKDSTTIDPTTNKPIFMKGDVVTRQKETVEFKSFAGNNRGAELAQGASAFGLNFIVQMG